MTMVDCNVEDRPRQLLLSSWSTGQGRHTHAVGHSPVGCELSVLIEPQHSTSAMVRVTDGPLLP